jgi:signal transduction histidine kinase/FixJ family two-component response regulator
MAKSQKSALETILLVDDEDSIRTVLGISLNDDGYEVITAANGREALNLFHKHQPPIVLTDIKMPGVSGIELLEKIKETHPDTEVIMITGHGDMDLAIKSLKMDATDFITKPINDDALAIALKRARERIHMRQKLHDYTEKLEHLVKEKAGRLNVSEQSYRQLFDQSPCYITVQDRDLKLKAANKRFTAEFEGDIGQHCYQAYKNRSNPCPECPVEATFADSKPHQSEMQVTAKTGEQYHLFIATAPIFDQEGRVDQVIEMSTNITELRHLQDHLASLGLRVSSISHAVKGLLTNLDGGMYLLESGFRQDNREKAEDGLEIVKFTTNRIHRMILDILYFAKERPLQVESTDVVKFADDIAVTFEARLQGKNIVFEYHGNPVATTTEIDPTVMRNALLNILDNATDACMEEKTDREKKIAFGMQNKQDYLVFDIIDNGIGMDKETTENLFDLFFSSKGHRGTGIGLFVAHQIISQHGGTIHVSSKKGQGAHFRVVIPTTLS